MTTGQGTFLGADTAALRQLGQSMSALSAEVERVTATTSAALEQLSWTGADRTGFWGDWAGRFTPVLRQVASALADGRTSVDAQADDQERASGGGTGGGSAAGAVAAGAGAGATLGAVGGQTNPQGGERLGELSRRYESNGNPGTVSTGRGDHGGVSYGTYQFASRNGSAAAFVESLRTTNPEYHQALSGARPGTAEFSTAWRELAARDPQGFETAQHDYIRATHYEPQLRDVGTRLPGLDVENRSAAVRDVLWSTSVQHGGATDTIFERALAGRDPATVSDADLIRGVYAERGRDGGMAYFPSSSAEVREGVVDRFAREQRDALARLPQ